MPGVTLPVSLHTGTPEPQLMAPVRHGFVGLHAVPAEHGLHVPALQTPPGQTVPFIFALPSVHTDKPEPHSTVPLRHAGFGLPAHDAPWLHGLHMPPLQTPPVQLVPFGFVVPSRHTELPVEQSTVPLRHAALGLVVHALP